MRATLRADGPSLAGVPDLPAAARLVAWGNACLTGAVSPDEAAERVTGPTDATHRVFGLPGRDRRRLDDLRPGPVARHWA